VTILCASLLAFTGLVFWSTGSPSTWVFNGVFQMRGTRWGCNPAGCDWR
jgi:hypothetical protein